MTLPADKVLALAKEAGALPISYNESRNQVEYSLFGDELTKFAALLQQQMIEDGWRQCAVGQGTTQFCGVAEELEPELYEVKSHAERYLFIRSIINFKGGEDGLLWAYLQLNLGLESSPPLKNIDKYIDELIEQRNKKSIGAEHRAIERARSANDT